MVLMRAAAVSAPLLLMTLAGQVTAQQSTRDQWQRVPEIVAALDVGSGSHVADVGAGFGYFTVRLARVVGPVGRVYAVDISAEALERLRRLADTIALRNVEVVEGRPEDPRLAPGTLDAALIVNAYHEMTEHDSIAARLFQALKPGGRLVLVEPIVPWMRDSSRGAQELAHQLAPAFARADLERAGFEVQRVEDVFTRNSDREMWLLVARRPTAAAGRRP
jgi:predicted methyltransferase